MLDLEDLVNKIGMTPIEQSFYDLGVELTTLKSMLMDIHSGRLSMEELIEPYQLVHSNAYHKFVELIESDGTDVYEDKVQQALGYGSAYEVLDNPEGKSVPMIVGAWTYNQYYESIN